VFEQTEVRRSHRGEEATVFYTADNQRIEAEHAVFATGYETQEIKKNANAVMESSYAIATQPLADISGWPGRCLIWETARPYLYLRTTVDGRIVAGGFDEAILDAAERDACLPAKTERLLGEVRKLFPALTDLRAEYAWAATFGSTHDGLPLIGPQEGFPRCFFLMGYGGNGTVYSIIGAEIIADLIQKGEHPDAHLFRIDRPQRTMGQG
jgi:glycine/D-amino acid oxidase-like deaminating enzyme